MAVFVEDSVGQDIKKSIRLWYLLVALFFLRPISTVLWPFMLSREVTLDQKGYILTIGTVLATLAALAMARVADRFSYRKQVLLGFGIDTAGWVFCTVASSWHLIAVGYSFFLVANIFCFMQMIGWAKLLSDSVLDDDETTSVRLMRMMNRKNAIFNSVFVINGALAGVLLWWLGTAVGLYVALGIAIATGLAAIFVAWRMYEPPRVVAKKSSEKGSWRRELTPSFLVLFLLLACSNFIIESPTVWRQPYMLATGFSAAGASFAQGAVQLFWAAALLIISMRQKLQEHIEVARWPFVCLAIVMPASMLCMGYTNSPILAFLLLLFFGSGIGLSGPAGTRFQMSTKYPAQNSFKYMTIAQLVFALYSPISGHFMQLGAERGDTLGGIQEVVLWTAIGGLLLGVAISVGVWRYVPAKNKV